MKFCGMVQDVHDPEYFDGAYEVTDANGATTIRTTKYQGEVPGRAGETLRSRDDIVWQRVPVVCVPPAEVAVATAVLVSAWT